jgi:prophage regulatory protein
VTDAIRFLRLPAVLDRVGISKPTVYRMIKEGVFPAPRHLSGAISYWPDFEIEAWQKARIADDSANSDRDAAILLKARRRG